MIRILIVEDDPDVRQYFAHVLTENGHAIDAASTVAEARSLLDARRYDLLIADEKLPDGSGVEIIKRAEGSGTRTLLVTGYGLPLPVEHLGSRAFLLKPVRCRELLSAVRAALDERPA